MKTLQEWSNFTGWYVAQDGSGDVYAYHDIPIPKSNSEWTDNCYHNAMKILGVLVEPFKGNWEYSLTIPKVTCPVCKGAGYYEHNGGCIVLVDNNSKCGKCKGSSKVLKGLG